MVSLLTAVGGCATTPSLVPVSEPDTRVGYNGFSLLPPSGSGWSWVGRAEQDRSRFFETTFVKRDGTRTCVARAWLLETGGENYRDPDRLLRYVRSAPIMQENARQSNMSSAFSVVDTLGPPCVRYDFDAIDTRAPGQPRGKTFDIDGHGLVCSHPYNEGVIGWFAYSRRSPQGQDYVASVEEGERFLESVRFEQIRR